AGSAGLDLATAVGTLLESQNVYLIDSTMRGPLGRGLSALLLGRSSLSRQGIFVVPGVIDADATGVIKIMVYTLTPPVFIPANSKIAQLVPFKASVPHAEPVIRGDQGFGSTGPPEVMLAIDIQRGKPEERYHPCGQSSSITMLVDTGADVTIIP
ncbi:DUT nucleotidohydrolase, partial [Scopus umbretta]|nr:DUT nucleotidohydrolase [Scopus umbretta]